MSVVKRMRVYYPPIKIPMFDGIVKYVVGDDALLSSSTLSGGRATSGWTIVLNIEIKFQTLGERSDIQQA